MQKDNNYYKKLEQYIKLKRELKKQRKFFIIAIILLAILIYSHFKNESEKYETTRKEQERTEKMVQESLYWSMRRAIPELTFYHKGFCIWVREYDNKYYIDSFL